MKRANISRDARTNGESSQSTGRVQSRTGSLGDRVEPRRIHGMTGSGTGRLDYWSHRRRHPAGQHDSVERANVSHPARKTGHFRDSDRAETARARMVGVAPVEESASNSFSTEMHTISWIVKEHPGPSAPSSRRSWMGQRESMELVSRVADSIPPIGSMLVQFLGGVCSF